MTELIEGEIISTDLVYQPPQQVTLFGTNDPAAVVAAATEAARPLAAVVEQQELFKLIQGKRHILVEGWTMLGAMLGVFPILDWSRPLDNGWEARVEARTLAGALVGAAEAQCTRSEQLWANREDYALRSMAQTRATSKALRQPLGFVMSLAGFSATPAEEMVIEAKPAAKPKDKAPAMRTRIKELSIEADTARGDTKTAAEVEAAFVEMKTTLAKATVEELQIVGTDLKAWVDAGCTGEFKPTPF